MEEWRDVVGYEGFYKVSNTGLVASMPRDGSDGRRKRKGGILNGCNTYSGPRVRLCVDGERNAYNISNLVAISFIGKKSKDMVVIHRDGDSLNNKVENLRYGTWAKSREITDKRWNIYNIKGITITKEVVNYFFNYKDGSLFYKKRIGVTTEIDKISENVQKRTARIIIGGRSYLVSKIVYLYHHGVLPKSIKYLDGDCTNTRIDNLISALIIDSDGIIYDSIRIAAHKLNIPRSTLTKHLLGQLKHARGYIFKYV